MGSLSIWHWLIVLLIVVLVFGTRKLPNVAKDLGSAIKGFKQGLREGAEEKPAQQVPDASAGRTIDVQAKEKSGS